jgi:hypothetical protein
VVTEPAANLFDFAFGIPRGDAGAKGDQGVAGPVGATGPQGVAGAAGAPGAVGPQGVKGDKGDTGAAGAAGAAGPQGPQGVKGDTGYNTAPIGSTMSWTSHTLPEGYVLADGVQYTQALYPQGYAFAKAEADSGNTLWAYRAADLTFNVPNLTDTFIYNRAASNLGTRGGEATHLLTAAESGVPAHVHPLTNSQAFVQSNSPAYGYGGGNTAIFWDGSVNSIGNNAPAPAAQAHNNLPPYVALAQVVKVAGVTASASVIQGPPGAPGPVAQVTQEGWHNVGAAGEPAFQNGFHNQTGAGLRPLRFMKDPAGVVRVEGDVDGPVDNIIFTLPPGYRPPIQQYLPVLLAAGASGGYLNVGTNGAVSVTKGVPTGVFMAFEFRTDQTTWPAGKSIIPLVTALPAGPTDGDEVYFQASAAAGVIWHLRYRAASASAYKWECVGGPALISELYPNVNGAPGIVSSVITAFDGPLITLPLAGEYDFSFGARTYHQNVAGASVQLVLYLNGVQGQSIDHYQGTAGGATTLFGSNPARTHRDVIGAGQVADIRYGASAPAGVAHNRWLRAAPVRVG